MRIILLILVSVFLLSGCGGNTLGSADITSQEVKVEVAKKPRIPVSASALDAKDDSLDGDDMDRMLDEIDKEINRPNISQEDIKRGWYYGTKDDKKFGTPTSWIWVDGGDESKWVSPNSISEDDYMEVKELCSETAGTYVISCLDTESSDCEYIPKTECRCIEQTKWYDNQGCILTDEEGGYISITDDELRQGWYKGLPTEKKLNTPQSWVWVEGGQDSKWQNPSPK